MFGLPQQSTEDALDDLQQALACQPTHLSWYQLTIEPNTVFYKKPPLLPAEDAIWETQLAGIALLEKHGFHQYEVSAYAQPHRQCAHNLNYWEFGDYLGIGAGAHSKITNIETGTTTRFAQVRQPRDYLLAEKRLLKNVTLLNEKDLIFEFMLNALRLTDGVPLSLFSERTGLPLSRITAPLMAAKQRGLLLDDDTRLCPSEMGRRFLNDLVGMFIG